MQGITVIRATLRTPSISTELVALATPTQKGIKAVSEGRRRPKYSLLYLDRFDGEDQTTYLAFKGYLKVKFRIDLEAIGGETEKVWYSYGHLTGRALERIFP